MRLNGQIVTPISLHDLSTCWNRIANSYEVSRQHLAHNISYVQVPILILFGALTLSVTIYSGVGFFYMLLAGSAVYYLDYRQSQPNYNVQRLNILERDSDVNVIEAEIDTKMNIQKRYHLEL